MYFKVLLYTLGLVIMSLFNSPVDAFCAHCHAKAGGFDYNPNILASRLKLIELKRNIDKLSQDEKEIEQNLGGEVKDRHPQLHGLAGEMLQSVREELKQEQIKRNLEKKEFRALVRNECNKVLYGCWRNVSICGGCICLYYCLKAGNGCIVS